MEAAGLSETLAFIAVLGSVVSLISSTTTDFFTLFFKILMYKSSADFSG